MSKIARAYQKLFASTAGGTEVGKFGSLAAGSPAYTTDPTVIQSLTAFLNGWYAAIIGNNSPPIQDMNALFFLAFRQIAYGLQQGIPEWDATTEYWIDGFCAVDGVIYKSLTDTNVGNAVTDTAHWSVVSKQKVITTIEGNSTWVCPDGVSKISVRPAYLKDQDRINPDYLLLDSGALYSWGDNSKGQLGDGTTVKKSSPVLVVGGYTWKTVASCNINSVSSVKAITISGDMYGWGNNDNGEIGDSTRISRSSPVIILSGTKFKKVVVSNIGYFAIATSGEMYGYGMFPGDGTIVSKSSPVLVAGGRKWKYISLASGNGYGDWQSAIAAITTDGDLYTWGTNALGQLGDGTVSGRSSPVLVTGGHKWKEVVCGDGYMLGITDDGSLYSWGRNTSGQLGDGTVVDKSSPVLVLGGMKYKTVGTSGWSSSAITETGELYSWGNNAYFTLGDGTSIPKSSPVLILSGTKFKQIINKGHVAYGFDPFQAAQGAIAINGDAYGWGNNSVAGLGTGDVLNKSTPTLVAGGKKWAHITPMRAGPQSSSFNMVGVTLDGNAYG